MNMDTGSGIMWFFKDRSFDDKSIHDMFNRCRRLEDVDREIASETWGYLKSTGIPEGKLSMAIRKCPEILTLDLHDKLVPMIQCLGTLESRPKEVASAITKFPHILLHSLEEKLCPLLAFFEVLGAPEKQLGKLILLNPRIISYGIESRLSQMVDFLASLGLSKDGMIGRYVAKHPFITRYSIEKRLKPTCVFLRSLGLTESQLQRAAMNFPEVLCRDVNRVLRPNVVYLKSCGFSSSQLAAVVGGYPLVLIKSISKSLRPRIKFLKEVMRRRIDEIAEYPGFFRHGTRRLESRQKLLTQKGMECSLSEMLDCKHKRFLVKFGV
ncbi:transcription termination factor MTERF6, chloroplastic/mitochondrial-like isoform X1 [Salvia miltiorrhiza]|uniref:transcription termination factor MTERF6, chloroplastic/mitochondrial-like isoform X1 n=2 Tax=Salvia miltiorrhiza TaxID=226208 RepID=UPI0025AD33A2|nr:transcription termination factor MTERF6, chloroplastic/mitochondrial-like isoform X1 [Salvia miltiorrhiza]